MDMAKEITPVIMVGGSRGKYDFFSSIGRPKPFLKLLSAHSPFQQTIFRTLSFQKPVIICHERYHAIVQEQLDEINVEAQFIILEPVQKGSTVALALASLALKNQNPILAIMPCSTSKADPYQDILDAAVYADSMIVMLGQKLKRSARRYGLITADFKTGERCHAVRSFVQDPGKLTPSNQNDPEGHFWSAGFLIFRPRFFLDVLSRLNPDIYKDCERAFFAGSQKRNFYRIDAENYARIRGASVGEDVIEKIKETCVIEIKQAS